MPGAMKRQTKTKAATLPPVMQFSIGDGMDTPARVSGVPVFRADKYPQGEFTPADLAEMAANYDPEFLEAPLTPDHEQTGPAWGWWDRFYTVDTPDGKKELYGDVTLLPIGEFMWTSGLYKRRSIEVYTNQPLPNGKNGMYVKAVSLLGAATPAVKGLRNMFMASPGVETQKAFGHALTYTMHADSAVETFQADYPVEDEPAAPPVPVETPEQQEAFFSVSDLGKVLASMFGFPAVPPQWVNQFGGNENMTIRTRTTQAPATPPAAPDQSAADAGQDTPQNFQADANGNVTLTAEQFAQFQMTATAVNDLNTRLAQEEQRREQAEQQAMDQSEEQRFSQFLTANREKISPAMDAAWRALFHAMPYDTSTESHLSFTQAGAQKTVSPRALILHLMSSGAKVIDLSRNPHSDNAAAAAFSTPSEVPAEHNSKAWVDYRHNLARDLQKQDPTKYADFTVASIAAEKVMCAARPDAAPRKGVQTPIESVQV